MYNYKNVKFEGPIYIDTVTGKGFRYRWIRTEIIRLETRDGSYVRSQYDNDAHEIVSKGFMAYISMCFENKSLTAETFKFFEDYYYEAFEIFKKTENDGYDSIEGLKKEFTKSHFSEEEANIKEYSSFFILDNDTIEWKRNVEGICIRYLEWLKKQLPKERKEISFKWQGDIDNDIPKLYNLMVEKYKLILPETTYEQLKNIFSGQLITNIQPVKWHEDNASELLYFNLKIQPLVDQYWSIYKRLEACFVKPNGERFSASFKNLKGDILLNLSLSKRENIDNLYKELIN